MTLPRGIFRVFFNSDFSTGENLAIAHSGNSLNGIRSTQFFRGKEVNRATEKRNLYIPVGIYRYHEHTN